MAPPHSGRMPTELSESPRNDHRVETQLVAPRLPEMMHGKAQRDVFKPVEQARLFYQKALPSQALPPQRKLRPLLCDLEAPTLQTLNTSQLSQARPSQRAGSVCPVCWLGPAVGRAGTGRSLDQGPGLVRRMDATRGVHADFHHVGFTVCAIAINSVFCILQAIWISTFITSTALQSFLHAPF